MHRNYKVKADACLHNCKWNNFSEVYFPSHPVNVDEKEQKTTLLTSCNRTSGYWKTLVKIEILIAHRSSWKKNSVDWMKARNTCELVHVFTIECENATSQVEINGSLKKDSNNDRSMQIDTLEMAMTQCNKEWGTTASWVLLFKSVDALKIHRHRSMRCR